MKLPPKYLFSWFIIPCIYLLVLYSIGQLAFTGQYFNEADSMIGEFLIIKESHGVNVKDDQESNKLINSLMEASANASNDLQEMASQSFNIILGALLAYMSASANVVFQAFTSSDKPAGTEPSEDTDDETAEGACHEDCPRRAAIDNNETDELKHRADGPDKEQAPQGTDSSDIENTEPNPRTS